MIRQHPVTIIKSNYKYYLLLLLPLIRGVVFSWQGLYIWLRGAWFDLLILALIFMLGFARWYFYCIWAEEDRLIIEGGILNVKYTSLDLSKISSVMASRSFFLRLLGVSYIRIDADAAIGRKRGLVLTLKSRDAHNIYESIAGEDKTKETDDCDITQQEYEAYNPKRFPLAALAFFNSDSFAGLLFGYTLFSQSGKILGSEWESQTIGFLTRTAHMIAFGFPPTMAVVAYALLAGWLISFLILFLRYRKFNVSRHGDKIVINLSFIRSYKYSLSVCRINAVFFRQTLLTKLMRLTAVFIHCAKYGAYKNELSLLIPFENKTKARNISSVILPEIKSCKKTVSAGSCKRFVIPSVIYTAINTAMLVTTAVISFPYDDIAVFILLMLLVWNLWKLVVNILAYKHTGLGACDDILTLYYLKGSVFVTAAIPESRVSKIVIKQNLFQKKSGLCNVVVYSYAEKALRHKIAGVPHDRAKDVLLLSRSAG